MGDSKDKEPHGLSQTLKQTAHDGRQKLHDTAKQPVSVHGHAMEKGAIFRLVALLAIVAAMAIMVCLLWPYLHGLFEEGGLNHVMNTLRDAGPSGVLILFGLQLLQIIVVVIPGEIAQVAAGLLYGPWLGAAIILAGCVASSALIFVIVRKLGAPFVQSMVSIRYLKKFEKFEESGKMNIIVFLLFLVPGLPKDAFTYLLPLTHMEMSTFLLLSTVGRIPGVIVSTYAAGSLSEGNYIEGALIFAVAAVIAGVCLIMRDKMMSLLEHHVLHRHK